MAETSRPRTRRAVSSTDSSQSSGMAAAVFPCPGLDLRHQEEGIQRRRSVGQEFLPGEALVGPILDLPRALGDFMGLFALESLELIDVVDDPGELTGELRLF